VKWTFKDGSVVEVKQDEHSVSASWSHHHRWTRSGILIRVARTSTTSSRTVSLTPSPS
jgi:hypothetical protein